MKQKCAACIQMASGKSEIMSEKTAVMSRALSHEWVSLEQLGEAIRSVLQHIPSTRHNGCCIRTRKDSVRHWPR